SHTCAVAKTPANVEGRVFCWGLNSLGRLGTSANGNMSTPIQVVDGGQNLPAFTSVASGGANSCALSVSGKVYCWGDDAHGQAGQSGYPVFSPAPVATGTTTFSAID